MIGSWTHIFAFWRVAKVKYEYFGRWSAGETLYHILELCPRVLPKSFNYWSLSCWSKQRLFFMIEFSILISSSSLFPHVSSSLRVFESSSILKMERFQMVVNWVSRKLKRNNKSKFEFCRRRFRGQRPAIIQGIQWVQRGATVRLTSYLFRSSFILVFLALWGASNIVCQPLPPTEQSEQNGLSGPPVW